MAPGWWSRLNPGANAQPREVRRQRRKKLGPTLPRRLLKDWREYVGIEPTADRIGRPLDLKSKEGTRPPPTPATANHCTCLIR